MPSTGAVSADLAEALTIASKVERETRLDEVKAAALERRRPGRSRAARRRSAPRSDR